MTLHRARLCALALVALLGACGGGGGSSGGSSVDVSSRSTAQSVTASGAALPTDSTEAISVAVTTAQATISGSCAGGGTDAVSISGGTVASRANGAYDTGEVYDFMFTQCRSKSGASAVNGRLTLTVVSTTPSLVVDTTSTNLSVTLPQRTVTLNGSSTLTQTQTQTASGSGANSTTVNQWTSSGIHVDSARPSGTSHYELRNVDYTRRIVAINGSPISSTSEGQSTLEAQLLFVPWLITLATLGPVDYGPTGAVISGRWSIDTPDDHLELQISPLGVSLKIDFGNNGHYELTFVFQLDTFFDAAG